MDANGDSHLPWLLGLVHRFSTVAGQQFTT